MKTMNRMRMRECCCSCLGKQHMVSSGHEMMATPMKGYGLASQQAREWGGVHIIIGVERVKRKTYEKDRISNSIGIKPQPQQRLGQG